MLTEYWPLLTFTGRGSDVSPLNLWNCLPYSAHRVCTPKLEHARLRHELSWACSTFNAANVSYWIDAGSLLGGMRDHDVLKHDTDLDVAYLWKDKEKVREAVGTVFGRWGQLGTTDLLRYGLETDASTGKGKGKGKEYVVRVNAEHETTLGDKLVVLQFGRYPAEWYFPLRTLGHGVLGHCKVPNQAVKVLEEWYGSGAMHPVACQPHH